ncbi:MAG: VOC family protein [Actinomycetota bacterium]
MELRGIHHVSINVRDTAEAVEFYTSVLGFDVRADRPDLGFAGAWLDVGDQQVHLLEMRVPDNHGQHYAVAVADLDGAIDHVRQHGVEVSDPRTVGTGRQSFLQDPSGNTIELHQPAE